MTWLTWRQLRVSAAALYGAVLAAAVVLAVTGPRVADKAGLRGSLFDNLTRLERDLFYGGVIVLAVAPAVVGAFWGAPLVARELESGTHRLVWNQSVTRNRWLATKLGLTAGIAAIAVGGLTLAITWWSDPVDGALSNTRGSLPVRLSPSAFAMRGIVPVAYVVFALVLGAAVGLVLKRSVPAMAVTLVVYVVVQIAMPLWVRPHLWPPVTKTVAFSMDRLDGISGDPSGRATITLNTGGHGDWILSNRTVNSAGQDTALPSWMVQCVVPPIPSAVQGGAPPSEGEVQSSAEGKGGDQVAACFDRMNAEGYRQRIVYQPASHFWPLQYVETGVVLALSGLLAWFCFWRIRQVS
jgi:hypothetical protein